jgi:hypothetical protein
MPSRGYGIHEGGDMKLFVPSRVFEGMGRYCAGLEGVLPAGDEDIDFGVLLSHMSYEGLMWTLQYLRGPSLHSYAVSATSHLINTFKGSVSPQWQGQWDVVVSAHKRLLDMTSSDEGDVANMLDYILYYTKIIARNTGLVDPSREALQTAYEELQ